MASDPTGSPDRRPLAVQGAVAAGMAVAYFAVDLVVEAAGFGPSRANPVWLPAGVAVGAALRWGWIALPSAVAGAVAASLVQGAAPSVYLLFADGVAPAAEVALALALCRRAGFDPDLRRVRDVGVLLAGGAVVPSLAGASAGIFGALLAGIAGPDALVRMWGVWWLGDAVGVLLMAPLILTWSQPGRPGHWQGRTAEAVVTLVLLAWTTALVFMPGPLPAGAQPAVAFLTFPLLLWAAFRLGPVGAATGAALCAAVAVAATARGVGPFAVTLGMGALAEVAGFAGALALSGLLLAAAASERHRAEGAREVSESRLALAQWAGRMGTWEWDVVGDRIRWSQGMGPLFGRPEGWEPSGGLEDFLALVHLHDRGRVLQSLRGALDAPASGDHYEMEFRVAGSEAPRWQLAIGQVQRDAQGRATSMLGAAVDISARKLLEQEVQQAQKMDSIGRLAGGVAHDFNNLLTVILGESELALDGADPPREHVERIREAAERASQLTGALLAFARRQVLQPQVLEPGSLVLRLEPLLRRLLGEDVALQVELADDVWPVRADAHQLEQVIINLAVNAREAMPQGGRLHLAVRNGKGPGGRAEVHLSVADTGAGMEPEVRERIFEPFFTTKPYGTGLGLAVCFGIVTQMGGLLEVDSEPGKGTQVRVRMPQAEAGAELPATPAAPAREHGEETLLLVEDDEAIRDLARRGLEARGFKVLAASDAASALESARGHAGPIHALVTDVILPGMNGRELADRLSRERPGLPTLFISGYSADAIARHGVLEPGVVLLEKPFTPRILAERIRALLG